MDVGSLLLSIKLQKKGSKSGEEDEKRKKKKETYNNKLTFLYICSLPFYIYIKNNFNMYLFYLPNNNLNQPE